MKGTSTKQIALRAYMAGYELGMNVEDLSDIAERTAQRRFKRWWDLEVE